MDFQIWKDSQRTGGRGRRMLHGATWTVGVGVAPLSSIYGRGGVGVHLVMAPRGPRQGDARTISPSSGMT
ncbi:hypothetical protein BDZ89DRAFT_1071155, partial [Hymenopellis radicata]